MMEETTITFVVNYDDPDRSVEGLTKTRHFASSHQAEEWISDDLPKMAPNYKNLSLTKITCRKERIF